MANNTLKSSSIDMTSSLFNKRWMCDKTLLTVMADVMNNQTFLNNISYLFNTPSEFFISLMAYPFDVKSYFYPSSFTPPTSRIKIGSSEIQYNSQYVSAKVLPSGTFYKWICSYTIPRRYDNFLDYSPYTKIEMYIPFCGFIQLDNTTVMGYEIRLFYSIDWSSGGLNAYIVRYDPDSDSSDLIQTTSGQIGFEIPLGSSNATDRARNVITTTGTMIAGTVGTLATGNPLPLLLSSIGITTKSINSQQVHVSKGSTTAGSNSLVTPRIPYIVYTYYEPNVKSYEQYALLKGRPLQRDIQLSELTGFTQIGQVHVEIENATSSEISEVETLLKSGIIL